MKKIISTLLAVMLLLGTVPAMAATKAKGNTYSMPAEGTVLQNIEDRNITLPSDLSDNPVIPGESTVTGLPLAEGALYLPMLVQISNPVDKETNIAGTGYRAPWGGQYADIMYEGILTRKGETRVTFLFSDSLADNQPLSAGPVRSARIGHVLLREEWQGGLVFAGGPNKEDNNIKKMLKDFGATSAGVVFNLLDGKYTEYKQRVSGLAGPNNLDVNVAGIRTLIPSDAVATPHPFLFTDASPYVDGYDLAYSINLDWGHKHYISHLRYDENENIYLRYTGDYPYISIAACDDRSDENATQMSFSNVIIQRIEYEYVNGNSIMPDMQSVGKGNADIFIAGRYIPGYWVREDVSSPTIFFDDQGNQLELTRGKTYIAHFPPESLLTYQAD